MLPAPPTTCPARAGLDRCAASPLNGAQDKPRYARLQSALAAASPADSDILLGFCFPPKYNQRRDELRPSGALSSTIARPGARRRRPGRSRIRFPEKGGRLSPLGRLLIRRTRQGGVGLWRLKRPPDKR